MTRQEHIVLLANNGQQALDLYALTASLPILTIATVFHSMSKKEFSLSSLVADINASATALLPANRFIATNLLTFNFKNQTIESWFGGNPESFILNKHGDIVHTLTSRSGHITHRAI